MDTAGWRLAALRHPLHRQPVTHRWGGRPCPPGAGACAATETYRSETAPGPYRPGRAAGVGNARRRVPAVWRTRGADPGPAGPAEIRLMLDAPRHACYNAKAVHHGARFWADGTHCIGPIHAHRPSACSACRQPLRLRELFPHRRAMHLRATVLVRLHSRARQEPDRRSALRPHPERGRFSEIIRREGAATRSPAGGPSARTVTVGWHWSPLQQGAVSGAEQACQRTQYQHRVLLARNPARKRLHVEHPRTTRGPSRYRRRTSYCVS